MNNIVLDTGLRGGADYLYTPSPLLQPPCAVMMSTNTIILYFILYILMPGVGINMHRFQ